MNDNLRGALFMTLGMAGFAASDVVTKGFAGEWNIGQLVFVRGLIAMVIVFAAAWPLGHLRPASHAFHRPVFLRGVGEVIGTFTFIIAIFNMPIATVSAIMQALPLAVTLGAAVFLAEPVGWRRLTAILVGFAAVLLIVRPGMDGFSIHSLAALGCIAGCTLRDLAARRIALATPSLFATLVTAIIVTLAGGALALFEEWRPMTGSQMVRIVLASVFLIAGYYFSIAAMRVGEIAFVSPFRYFVLIFSVIGAMIVYSEFPDAITYVGGAIIVATGIYSLWREQVRRNAQANA
jgi:drug/metabolite transporter (DMT)-like permease